MALEIIKLYISQISELFSLSDPAVAISRSKQNSKPPSDPLTGTSASFVPLGTTSFTASFYFHKIVAEIGECINDMGPNEVSTEAVSGLNGLFEAAKWRFVDVLSELWLRGTSYACLPQ